VTNPIAAAPDIRAETLVSAGQLDALRPEWEILWTRSRDASPFQHPAWVLTWWRHFGHDGLHVIAVRVRQRLAGMLALSTTPDGSRRLGWLTKDVPGQDLLVENGVGAAVAQAALDELAKSEEWDEAILRGLPAGSPLLQASIPAAMIGRVDDEEPSSVLVFPPAAVSMEAALPLPLAGRIRALRLELEKAYTVRLVSVTTPHAARRLLSAIERLNDPADENGNAQARAFNRAMVHATASHGLLRMTGLSLDGELAAGWYGLEANRQVHTLRICSDRAFDGLDLPLVLLADAVMESARGGARAFRLGEDHRIDREAWEATEQPGRRLMLAPRDERYGLIHGRTRERLPEPSGRASRRSRIYR
jgi:CelD/BcsL family acetyltransferase involved in cellulose biosynthesis